MSQETSVWLNTNTLIGFTEKRGTAWHYRAESQGDESNHYPGAIPVDDVRRRLFHWSPVTYPVFVQIPATVDDATGMDDEGNPVRVVQLDDRQAIARDDTEHVFQIFKDGYSIHAYDEWLIDTVAAIIGDTTDGLGIASAGLLKEGGVAWVTIEVPESIDTPEGLSFRPFLTAATSLDGSLSSTFKRGAQLPVCDNTLEIGLMGTAGRVKVRHTRNSGLALDDVRDAMGIIVTTAEQFATTVAALSSWKVSTREFDLFLDAVIPVAEDAPPRARTLALAKRDAVSALYQFDDRAAPWNGTALGVLQATNTYAHHVSGTRGDRGQRNAMRALSGATARADVATLSTLADVAPPSSTTLASVFA